VAALETASLKSTQIAAKKGLIKALNNTFSRVWVEQVRLIQIHLKLQPMTHFPMVQRPLAPADHRLHTRLQI
jgi:hypothetical protein